MDGDDTDKCNKDFYLSSGETILWALTWIHF